MKYIIAFIFLSISFYGISQQNHDLDDFVEVSMLISEEKEVAELFKYKAGNQSKVYFYANGLVYDLIDTAIHENSRIIIHPHVEELFMIGQTYWLGIVNYEKIKNKINYVIKVQSFSEIDSLKYSIMEFNLKKDNGTWKVLKKEFKNHKYENYEMTSHKCIQKTKKETIGSRTCIDYDIKKLSKRNFQSTNDTLIGNWQVIMDSVYYEILFANDSLYGYTIEMGNLVYQPYDIVESRLVMHENSIWEIEIKNLDRIEFAKIKEQRRNHLDSVFIFERISEEEFTFDKVKCWEWKLNKDGSISNSKKEIKYHKEFQRRRHEYMNNAL